MGLASPASIVALLLAVTPIALSSPLSFHVVGPFALHQPIGASQFLGDNVWFWGGHVTKSGQSEQSKFSLRAETGSQSLS